MKRKKYKKIFDYFFNQIKNSMTFYWVNGSDQKRLLRMAEYCHHRVLNLTKKERDKILKKIKKK